MIAVRSNKRERLVQTAVGLAHRQGFHQTSLADIAGEAGVPLGNVYYYFKTKEEIGQAIVEQHAASYRALRDRWDTEPSPKARLGAFVQVTLDHRHQLALSGSPIGSLCSELQKEGGALAEYASGLLAQTLAWLALQFRELGNGDASEDLAVHLLSSLEGATLLTHSFRTPNYLEREAARVQEWITAL